MPTLVQVEEYNRAVLLLKDSSYLESKVICQRLIAEESQWLDPIITLGSIHVQCKEYDDAVGVFQQGIQQFPEEDVLRLNLGFALNFLGRKIEARDHLLYFISRNPTNHSVRLTLADELLIATGQFGHALELLVEGIRLCKDQKDFRAKINMLASVANCKVRLGDVEQGAEIYKALLEFLPDSNIRLRYGKVLLELGKYDDFEANQKEIERLGIGGDSLSGGSLTRIGLVDPFELNAEDLLVRSRKLSSGWHKGENIKFFPIHAIRKTDFVEIIKECVLSEFELMEPVFEKDAKLVTFGSCFASHLRYHLHAQGKLAKNIVVPEGLNNTFALENFISWCLTGNCSSNGYWYDTNNNEIVKWTPQREFEYYNENMKHVDGFVITLGLAEVWRDKETQLVFWRGVPEEIYDKERHEFVVSDVYENFKNLVKICDNIRAVCGDKPIVFTLSPVPLNATNRDVSCIEADAVSKSILRVAVDMLMREKRHNVYYWPSFEIVKWLPAHVNFNCFGEGVSPGASDDARHVRQEVVSLIISMFIKLFFKV